jgi:hypothetical protein
MKDSILNVINEYVKDNDMMDYTEIDLEILVRRVSERISRPVAIWVDEKSDGKYTINIRENGNEKNIDTVAWDTKEQFAESVYYLFK